MFNNFSNFSNWNDMYKNQQDMMNYWTDFYNPSAKKENESGFNLPGFGNFTAQDFFKQQKQMLEMSKYVPGVDLEKFQGFIPQIENWQKLMESYNPLEAGSMMTKNASDVYEKMMDSNMFYLNLYSFWENMTKEFIDPKSNEFKQEIEKMMNNYDTVIMEQFMPLMPQELQGLFMNPYNYIKNITSSYGQFMGPWADISKGMADTFAEAMLKDPSKLSDALKLWKEGYDETFGALMQSPAFGYSREDIRQNNKMINSLINFLVTSSDFFTNVSGVVNENSKKAIESYFEVLEEGIEPKTFNEFYEFWSTKVESALNEYFYTDEFSELIALTVDSIMEFKMDSDKFMEKLLENIPVVTNSEIDNVYKNVYTLKKEVRALRKELKELKKSINTDDKDQKTKSKK